MLDIGTSDTLKYDFGGRSYTIQIYKDNQDAKKYYIVPQPQFAIATSGLPEFSLQQFTNGAGVSGQCNFQTVLQTPPGAIEAVQQKFGSDVRIGGWDWTLGTTWFNYQYPDKDGQIHSYSAVAWPSLAPTTGDIGQASARASFLISLPDQAAVAAFITAFSSPGGGGTYDVQYQMHVPGSLPGVTVTIGFDSSVAYQYEQTIQVDKNVWGSETSRTVEINQYLSQSQSGTIDYIWGKIDPMSAQGQAITNWAQQTLQNAVTQSVNATIAMMQTNNPSGNDYSFSMSQVSSFSYTYSQNTVVDWIAQSSSLLPAFPADVWDRVYKVVDYTPLSVVFQLTNVDLISAGVASVQVLVQSPSGNDSATLTKDNTSWPFKRPAVSNPDGSPNLRYSYKYIVTYTDKTSYESPTIQGDAAAVGGASVTFTAGSLAALAVTFQTSGIQFGTSAQSVRQVQVDFVFVNTNVAPGQAAEAKTLNYVFYANEEKWPVSFLTALPYTTNYTYSVIYVMGDGSRVSLAPSQPTNQNSVQIGSPLALQQVTLYPVWTPGMENVYVSAYYVDPDNSISVQGNVWQVDQKGDPIDPWKFLAPNNKNAYCDVTVQYVDDGEIIGYPTPWYVPQRQPINVTAKQTPTMVTIDPSLIQWNLYDMVKIDIYLLNATGQPIKQHPFQFLKGTGSQYYSFMLDGQEPSLTWYYSGAYYPKDAAPVVIQQTKMTSALLVLPRTWSERQVLANERPYLVPQEHAHAIEAAHLRLITGVNVAREEALTSVK
ncbi:hypothetical protein SAMN04489802_1460 [Pseudomonas chlororaphis]|uniref:Uncharacterized protein n=2 Tax=Pseudomonas chlororaphis TaxID=587753 RepID=A0AB33WVZ2_9PSED|nr:MULTISPECIES: hypothetical protein [Pseudomonas]AIC21813.1 hypothetical protein EY04_23705 [Pseudomonas chlororaphis]AZD62571.1 hypothetical protein C4K18_4620 [Pseudomonas chlororaphis subsp. aurantiaca]AZD68935.1 hypothetical protein C4K17_5071 [Pseudomonas chlororaphis subsp. aurantiaca]AZD88015.1 hypothetical protein C4K14_5213 [Pseudomonas chlororaphis subsp. aureofaciens]AZE00743.1 hypothetical protein C4K12_4898 [Pseudomonas chlororaphis subsp. aureofaciens]